jgi:heavy metal efflux system protein
MVRSEGRIHTLDDIRSTVISQKSNMTVRVGDVAEVREGSLPRNGAVSMNGEAEAVWTTVLGLRGANAKTVVSGVKKRLAEIEKILPKGAKIAIFYDRNDLVEKAVWTVQEVLIEATLLVVILLLLFLERLRRDAARRHGCRRRNHFENPDVAAEHIDVGDWRLFWRRMSRALVWQTCL